MVEARSALNRSSTYQARGGHRHRARDGGPRMAGSTPGSGSPGGAVNPVASPVPLKLDLHGRSFRGPRSFPPVPRGAGPRGRDHTSSPQQGTCPEGHSPTCPHSIFERPSVASGPCVLVASWDFSGLLPVLLQAHCDLGHLLAGPRRRFRHDHREEGRLCGPHGRGLPGAHPAGPSPGPPGVARQHGRGVGLTGPSRGSGCAHHSWCCMSPYGGRTGAHPAGPSHTTPVSRASGEGAACRGSGGREPRTRVRLIAISWARGANLLNRSIRLRKSLASTVTSASIGPPRFCLAPPHPV